MFGTGTLGVMCGVSRDYVWCIERLCVVCREIMCGVYSNQMKSIKNMIIFLMAVVTE
jgi:hypothetical protein